IYAGEIKYLTAFINAFGVEVARAELTLSSPDWIPAARLPAPKLSLVDELTQATVSGVEVSGRLVNNDTSDFGQVTVVAVFYGSSGLQAGTSKTELFNLRPGENRAFSILHPALPSLNARRTEILLYALRPQLN
ncbi:MAG: FxLYD domain-containing protein, partial [Patescibacteria group bacterium]